MGRPRKSSGVPGARIRMIEAFWQQLATRRYSQVTATSITEKVGCNRATFYYHFDSIDDLALRAVEASMPFEIMALAEGVFNGKIAEPRLSDAARRSIERLCLLAGVGGTQILIDHFKSALKQAWQARFHLDTTRDDVQAVMSFMASGVVGILGDWEGRPCDAEFDIRLQTISQLFSGPAIEFAKTHRHPTAPAG